MRICSIFTDRCKIKQKPKRDIRCDTHQTLRKIDIFFSKKNCHCNFTSILEITTKKIHLNGLPFSSEDELMLQTKS